MDEPIFSLEPKKKKKGKRICKDELCKKHGSFGYDKDNLFCKRHKKDDMEDLIHKKCEKEGCETIPIYNYKGEKKGRFCKEHKLEGMINIKDNKCEKEECEIQGIFNYKGEKKGRFCNDHKLDGMIDIINPVCIKEGCENRPHYNYKGIKKALFCYDHKLDNMINVLTPRCIFENCDIQSTFNYKGKKKGLYCVSHKLDGMIDVTHQVCMYEDCEIRPNYNYEGESKGIYCVSHKLNGMIDVTHTLCKNDWCYTRVHNPKYEGYCLHCFANMFPDKPVSRNYKTKERSVVEFVKTTFPKYSWICDKNVENGCSKRRPDILCDLGYQVLIIEIDENQHIDYDCSCENKRIMELSQDINHRPLIFIRFNPDDYKKGEARITSCWGIGKSGSCSIKRNKKNEWTERLQTLRNQIVYWTNSENQTNKTVEVVQLFYDE